MAVNLSQRDLVCFGLYALISIYALGGGSLNNEKYEENARGY